LHRRRPRRATFVIIRKWHTRNHATQHKKKKKKKKIFLFPTKKPWNKNVTALPQLIQSKPLPYFYSF
ncbi:hypothetical protein, partial [Leptospira borgpetersenii]|uniref:hypothetical protein n=1 Tax=Leptospira borgpetersenii TaxID=174 RepID=UPI0027DD455D